MLTARRTLTSFATCLLVSGILTLTASAQLTSTPSSLSYGSVYLGTQSTAKSVTIKNTGTASVTINSISSSCPEYKLASGTTPFTLAAGKTTSYSMVLVPDVAQAFNCNETLAASGASNLVVPLTGTGLKSGANVTLSTTSLSFPNQKQGTSSANQSIVLTNTGTVSVKINTISVTPGPFSAQYTVLYSQCRSDSRFHRQLCSSVCSVRFGSDCIHFQPAGKPGRRPCGQRYRTHRHGD